MVGQALGGINIPRPRSLRFLFCHTVPKLRTVGNIIPMQNNLYLTFWQQN